MRRLRARRACRCAAANPPPRALASGGEGRRRSAGVGGHRDFEAPHPRPLPTASRGEGSRWLTSGSTRDIKMRGARRDSAAAIASAQASGVWKFGTPACASIASACGASGTRKAAIGFPAPALSMIGCTVEIGIERAPTSRPRRARDRIPARRSDVERGLHDLVARAGEREIDQARGRHRRCRSLP